MVCTREGLRSARIPSMNRRANDIPGVGKGSFDRFDVADVADVLV